jgi:hypothetical protein
MSKEELERLERIYTAAFGRALSPEEKRFLGLTQFLGPTYGHQYSADTASHPKQKKTG